MSKKNSLEQYSTESLIKERQTLGRTAVGLAAAMVVVCLILLYTVFRTQKNYALLIVILACMLSIIPSFIRLGQLNTEIKFRRKNDHNGKA